VSTWANDEARVLLSAYSPPDSTAEFPNPRFFEVIWDNFHGDWDCGEERMEAEGTSHKSFYI
jgi:hypothetical protein